jgi:iron complex transport system substrate-binding protein
LEQLPVTPDVLSMSPHSLEDVWKNLRELGDATGRVAEASALIQAARAQLDEIAKKASEIDQRPRVFCMEWVDPVFCAGHWVPEMVELAGGQDVLGRKWADSVRVTVEEVIASAPEVLIVMPCGCGTGEAFQQVSQLVTRSEWEMVPAVRRNRVYAVDAARFSRPCLRLVEGVELLAHLLRPDQFDWTGPAEAFSPICALGVPELRTFLHGR